MRFEKLMGKNAVLSMVLCSAASFSLLHADNPKECENEGNRKVGCIEKVYDDNGNLGRLEAEMPVKNGKVEGIYRRYYESGSLSAEKAFKNGKAEGIGKTILRRWESWV